MKKICALAVLAAFSLCPFSMLSAEEPKGPNVILIVMDTTRADHLGCYGYGRPTTPNIDEVAKESVLFTNAISVIPLTTPAHISIMTGIHPDRHLVFRNFIPVPEDITMLAQILKKAGYATAASVSSQLVGSHLGFDRGFDFFSGTSGTKRGLMRPGNETVDDAMNWLSANYKKKFFLWVHLYDPHLPYEPPDEFGLKFNKDYARYKEELGGMPQIFYKDLGEHAPKAGMDRKGAVTAAERAGKEGGVVGGKAPSPTGKRPIRTVVPARMGHMPFMTPEKVEQMIAAYDGELAFDDDLLGKIFAFLKKNRIYKDTVIIIMADHGEILHEKRDYFGHHEFLYQGSIHVPLIMRFPGVPPKIIKERIAIIDVLPTLLDGIGIKNKKAIDGISFWDAINGGAEIVIRNQLVILTNVMFNAAGAFSSAPPSGSPRRAARPAQQPQEVNFYQAFNKSALFQDNWKILKNNLPQEPYELYNIESDPGEDRDLYGTADFKQAFMQLQQALESYLYDKAGVDITTRIAPPARRKRDAEPGVFAVNRRGG
ncbi:MAG: sulfatase [Candidatus Omnitrophica bacterium]|nr:sulfatase [Candidatus Omnitrophota bacterium]